MKTPRLHVLRQAAQRGLALLAFASLSLLPARATLNGTFTIVSGDPRNPGPTGGAVWTYVSSNDDGVQYNLRGMLFAPETTYGSGPFPAVVVNHGKGETAEPDGTNPGYVIQCAVSSTDDSRGDWVHAGPTGSQGVVVIGVNLTHTGHTLKSSFLPAGGDGATTANIQRIQKVRELLANYPYFNPSTGTLKTDGSRIAIHGHSMGAYATGATLGTPPTTVFKVASHTAGGVLSGGSIETTPTQADAITVPYQRHHAINDGVVPLSYDQTLSTILDGNSVPNELRTYDNNEIPPHKNAQGVENHHVSYMFADEDGLNSWEDIELWWSDHGLFTGVDTTPPGNVTGLGATPGNGQVQLNWTNPGDADLTGIKVLRKTGSYPTSPTDGTVVQDALNTGVTDTGLTNGTTYFYKVFAHDAVPNYAAGAQISATPSGSSSLTVYSQAANDGWMRESGENTTVADFVDSTANSTSSLRAGDTNVKKQYRSIVSFDTSALPDGAVIDSVTLRLTRGTVVGNNTNMTGFGTLNVAIRGGSGFANAVALGTNDFANGTAPADLANVVSGGLTIPTANGQQTTGTLISGALAYVNKTGTTQFRVDFGTDDDNDTSEDYMGFYSGENATLSNKPQLVITYH